MRSELIGGYSYWQTSKKLRNLSLVLLANERSLLSVHQVQTGQGSGQPVNVVLTIRCKKDRLEFTNASGIGIGSFPGCPGVGGTCCTTSSS